MGFLSITPLALNKIYRNKIIIIGVIIILTSQILAFAQWVNFDFAWRIAEITNERFIRLWAGTTPGFAMNSVSLGYQLLLISPITIYFGLARAHNLIALRWLCAASFPMLFLPIQSRSVSVAFLLTSAAFLIAAFHPRRLFSIDRARAALLCFCVVLVSFLTLFTVGVKYTQQLVDPVSINQTLKYRAEKNQGADRGEIENNSVENDSGAIRIESIKAVIKSIETPGDFIFGPWLEKYAKHIPDYLPAVYPHNMLFNALLLSGVIGLILLSMTYILIVRIAKPLTLYFKDQVLFIAGLSLAAQIFNSMFHNDSLNHGSIYPWIISAFILGRTLELNLIKRISLSINKIAI